MKRYDVVIIGGGLGGLSCGAMLSKEGLGVCVLEQHSGIGGCLQSFRRGGYVLDTGMHYVGSLSEGQIMRQYFKYMGVIEKLRLRKLDEDGFDLFCFGDGSQYRHAMGYEHFIETLGRQFPEEIAGLKRFCQTLQDIGGLISPDILRKGRISNGGFDYMSMSAYEEIGRYIGNATLRNVLAGNCGLYAGDKVTTSLYEYGMITHSNIEGAYAFVDGSQQLADALVTVIRDHGGEVLTNSKVKTIHLKADKVDYVSLWNGETYTARYVISALHPALVFSLLENNTIYRKAFFTRINALRNTYGIFTTYLLVKPNAVRYENRNYYLFNNPDVWSIEGNYKGYNIPSSLMCMQPNAGSSYTKVVTLLTPMPLVQYERWLDTRSGHRGEDYEMFKSQFSEAVIDFAAQFHPSLRGGIERVYTASPLTYRDYTATPYGSAYGLVKDYHNQMVTLMPAKTRIGNLLLTGQNLNVHGCLGTVISSAVTCSEILGREYLTKKIGYA